MLSILIFFPISNSKSKSFVTGELTQGMRNPCYFLLFSPFSHSTFVSKLRCTVWVATGWTKYWLDDWAKKATLNGIKP